MERQGKHSVIKGRPIARGESNSAEPVVARDHSAGERQLDKLEDVCSIRTPATNKKFKRFGLRLAESVGRPECPYLTRWVLTAFGWSIRLHHWLASDDQRYPHDHAWDYTAIILRGYYWEWDAEHAHVNLRQTRDCTRYKAEHRHMVEIDKGQDCWSLLITKPHRRDWGFYVPGREKLLRPLRYFSRYGHHPCE